MARPASSSQRNLEDFAGIASDWFWETDADHRFVYFSAGLEEVTGVPISEMIGHRRDLSPLVADTTADFEAHLDDLRNHRSFRNFEYRVKLRSTDDYRWVRVSGEPVFDDVGNFLGYRGAGHNITDEKRALEKLEIANAALRARNAELNKLRRELELAAFEDPLTGLRNRRAFDTAIDAALAVERPAIALLLVDLDQFKIINDTYGHPAGDMALVTTAERLAQHCPTEAEAFRIGGDEFAVLFSNCFRPSIASDLADTILNAMFQPISFGDTDFSCAVSVGIAHSYAPNTSPSQLIARADAALYDAKHDGRNCARAAS
ncbi:MAG: sensor domain-containing diguanylate cyclase [Pseudomonadota bacterium]